MGASCHLSFLWTILNSTVMVYQPVLVRIFSKCWDRVIGVLMDASYHWSLWRVAGIDWPVLAVFAGMLFQTPKIEWSFDCYIFQMPWLSWNIFPLGLTLGKGYDCFCTWQSRCLWLDPGTPAGKEVVHGVTSQNHLPNSPTHHGRRNSKQCRKTTCCFVRSQP